MTVALYIFSIAIISGRKMLVSRQRYNNHRYKIDHWSAYLKCTNNLILKIFEKMRYRNVNSCNERGIFDLHSTCI